MSIINFRLHKSTIYIFYKIKAEKAPPHRGPGRQPAPGDSKQAARNPPPPPTHTPTTAAAAREAINETTAPSTNQRAHGGPKRSTA